MHPDPNLCPPDAIAALRLYVNRGIDPGDFLRAVLANDLTEAFGRADENNLDALPHIVAFVYAKVPVAACRSYERVAAWIYTRRDDPMEII